jgi:N utilization substance protein B
MPQRSASSNPDERTVARERALHLLYEADAKSITPRDVLELQPIAVDDLAQMLVEGVGVNAVEIDNRISDHLVGWTLQRMPLVDKIILRIATYELAERSETPTAVIINEAVELAKRFSTDESPRFVNGVLAALAREIRSN